MSEEGGRNMVERKTEHSKAPTSTMFCGNAAGESLPPMVVYKTKCVYDGWVNGGPTGSVFDCTDSGWFGFWILAHIQEMV